MNENQKIETGNDQEILPISSDQMYTNFGINDEKTLKVLAQQKESAAITMAKQAVSQYVNKHPETKFPEIKGEKQTDKANVELDLGDTSDFRSINDLSEDTDAKYVLSEEPPAQAPPKKEESALPKWPVYSQPVAQIDHIKSELQQVNQEKKHWNDLLKESEDAMK